MKRKIIVRKLRRFFCFMGMVVSILICAIGTLNIIISRFGALAEDYSMLAGFGALPMILGAVATLVLLVTYKVLAPMPSYDIDNAAFIMIGKDMDPGEATIFQREKNCPNCGKRIPYLTGRRDKEAGGRDDFCTQCNTKVWLPAD